MADDTTRSSGAGSPDLFATLDAEVLVQLRRMARRDGMEPLVWAIWAAGQIADGNYAKRAAHGVLVGEVGGVVTWWPTAAGAYGRVAALAVAGTPALSISSDLGATWAVIPEPSAPPQSTPGDLLEIGISDDDVIDPPVLPPPGMRKIVISKPPEQPKPTSPLKPADEPARELTPEEDAVFGAAMDRINGIKRAKDAPSVPVPYRDIRTRVELARRDGVAEHMLLPLLTDSVALYAEAWYAIPHNNKAPRELHDEALRLQGRSLLGRPAREIHEALERIINALPPTPEQLAAIVARGEAMHPHETTWVDACHVLGMPIDLDLPEEVKDASPVSRRRKGN